MNGVIIVYKEKGRTSFSAASQLGRITGEKKTGHTGTLDPDATGVLPVCLGKATKLMSYLPDNDKEYRAQLLFGKETDTLDISGSLIRQMPADECLRLLESKEKILKAICSFKGEIEQIPPMYSAVKVSGVKLVDAARRGQEIERKPRKVTIYDISNIEISPDLLSAYFTVSCSKGTYIRSLCSDIGAALGVPACMGSLERTRACGFGLEDCSTLSQIEKAKNEGWLSKILIPADELLKAYKPLTVTDGAVRRLVFGNFMYMDDLVPGQDLKKPGIYRIYDTEGRFYGLYRYNEGEKFYRCEKMFVDQKY